MCIIVYICVRAGVTYIVRWVIELVALAHFLRVSWGLQWSIMVQLTEYWRLQLAGAPTPIFEWLHVTLQLTLHMALQLFIPAHYTPLLREVIYQKILAHVRFMLPKSTSIIRIII